MGIKCGGSKILDIPESLLKASKSICKIDTSSKLSSGFLIKLFSNYFLINNLINHSNNNYFLFLLY